LLAVADFALVGAYRPRVNCPRRSDGEDITHRTATLKAIRGCPPATALFFALYSTALAAGPSFDCDQAQAADEVAICSSSQLSELDNLMDAGFQFLKAKRGKKVANRVARPLLALRQACGGDTACIQQRQADAIRTFRALGAPIEEPAWLTASAPDSAPGDTMPTEIGACTTSTIDEIGGRLEGDGNFDSGTAVGYANGGSQITYDKEWPIIRSRIGDAVRICLVSVPKDCPPGYDRGKVYHTTNLRSGESWELPDSGHMCGGA
jgi:uncharacterized protein